MPLDDDATNPKKMTGLQERVIELNDLVGEACTRDGINQDSYLAALYQDVSGLLCGITAGTIRRGQPRIVERLLQIVERYPDGKDPMDILQVIGTCGELGLTAEGHELDGIARRGIGKK